MNSYRVLDTLRQTASNAATPNNSRGWGTPNMCSIPTGVKDFSKRSNQLMIAPNPFNTIFSVALETYPESDSQIRIYNTLGALVKEIPLQENRLNYQCDLSEQSAGIYFLKLSDGRSTLTKKIVKQ
jgi:hypothetical protein